MKDNAYRQDLVRFSLGWCYTQDGPACPANSEKHRNTSCAGPSCI